MFTKTNSLNKLLTICCLLFFLFYVNISKAQIYVNNWVIAPSDTQKEKPLVYVDFWATWCAPCISSMPHTEGLQERFGDKVLFVYISDEPENKIRSFLKRKGYRFYTLSDSARTNFNAWNVQSIPFAMLMNPRGTVIWQGRPGDLSPELLQKYIRRYENQSGDPDRFIPVRTGPQPISDRFTTEKIEALSIRYRRFADEIPFDCSEKGKNVTCQGPLREIAAHAFGLEPYQVETNRDISLVIRMPVLPPGQQRAMLKAFLQKHWQIRQSRRQIERYVLTEKDTSTWLNRRLYRYADSPDQTLSLSDDTFLTIDNATPRQMARILSQQTGIIFHYQGQNTNVYDWNIRIDTPDELLRYLQNELNFEVKAEKRELPYISLSEHP